MMLNRYLEKVSRLFARPEITFLILYAITGSILIFLIPPGQVQDESTHFYRTYQVSTGQFKEYNQGSTSGGVLPNAVPAFFAVAHTGAISSDPTAKYHPRSQSAQLWHVKINNKEQSFVHFPTLASYPPVAYLPQAIGVLLGRLLTGRVVVAFYLARISSFLFYGVMVYLAIRIISRGKWVMAFLALMPMAIVTSVAVSADGPTLAFLLLFVALLLKGYDTGVLGKWEITGLAASAVALTLSKQTYYIFIPAVLILLFNKKLKDRWKVASITIGIVLIFLGSWAVINRGVSTSVLIEQKPLGLVTAPQQQESYTLLHPWRFPRILGNTVLTSVGNGATVSAMGVFGWLNVPLPYWTMFLLGVLIVLSFGLPELHRVEESRKPFGVWPSLMLIALGALNLLLLLFALYVYWTPYRSPFITGFQGRYLIPIAIFVSPVFLHRYRHTIKATTLTAAYCLVLATTIAVIAYRYYTLPVPF